MSTYGKEEYTVVTGTVAGIAAFNAAVDAQIALGYAPQPSGLQTDGTNVWMSMSKTTGSVITPAWTITIAPTVGAAGAGAFTVAGDIAREFSSGHKFSVVDSASGTNGVYTVRFGGATYSAPNTTIPVDEAVTSATISGVILNFSPF